jgi:hypothetical protein
MEMGTGGNGAVLTLKTEGRVEECGFITGEGFSFD